MQTLRTGGIEKKKSIADRNYKEIVRRWRTCSLILPEIYGQVLFKYTPTQFSMHIFLLDVTQHLCWYIQRPIYQNNKKISHRSLIDTYIWPLAICVFEGHQCNRNSTALYHGIIGVVCVVQARDNQSWSRDLWPLACGLAGHSYHAPKLPSIYIIIAIMVSTKLPQFCIMEILFLLRKFYSKHSWCPIIMSERCPTLDT